MSSEHYIIPIRNFKISLIHKDLKFIFDPKLNISLKYFSYEDDMERVDADDFSIHDQGQIKMIYNWGLRFDCGQKELYEYMENINLLMLAFRIFARADCSFEYILNVSNTHLSRKNIDIWKRSINTKKHPSIFNIESLRKIKEGYLRLQQFNSISARTKHSIQFLYLGYISFYWMQAFILFMTSLETLVSPNLITDKITSIIINRILKILPNNSICNKTQLNKIYSLRSDIVHGKILTNLQLEKEMPLLVKLQNVVLSIYNNMLQRDFFSIYNDVSNFEIFFDRIRD